MKAEEIWELLANISDQRALDRRMEERTGKYCDDGVDEFLDEEIMELLRQIWERKKKPIPALV